MKINIKQLPKFADLHCYGPDSISRPKESSYRLYFDILGDEGTIKPYIQISYHSLHLWTISEWRMNEVFDAEDYLPFVRRRFNVFKTPRSAYKAFREFFKNLQEIEYELEYTDKFGGEANYSWVERKTINASPNISDRALIRLAKKKIGLSGRHKTSGSGCDLRIDFPGTVLFITAKG